MPTITTCRCGSDLDTRGLCTHCDRPGSVTRTDTTLGFPVTTRTCPTLCAPCRRRDSYCDVCREHCGTPMAARYHSKICRNREAAAQT